VYKSFGYLKISLFSKRCVFITRQVLTIVEYRTTKYVANLTGCGTLAKSGKERLYESSREPQKRIHPGYIPIYCECSKCIAYVTCIIDIEYSQ